ncbi:MAG: thioredoxin domain-containing protein [Desulfuromonadales bacterium]|nr:thioredoxin domain-containing protein [Desulfuromonadales bacterium]
MMTTAPNKLNHLKDEKSPYLLQHVENPVDWYPWCEEALKKAEEENKPIFVSIGYSTCHWCHVMAHESFEDEQIATKLNQHCISIKVDREERPDIDASFMHACHMMNGHGGWPLNLFLTPTGLPFYAMTYVPKLAQGRSPGFTDIIDKVAELWASQREDLINAGKQLSQALEEFENTRSERELSQRILGNVLHSYRSLFDTKHAGFGSPPKFPQPHNPALLLRLAQRFDNAESQWMAVETLNSIAQGGITDQLGGGLHRYSVDERWLVPHFEKMLYDQALISDAYLDAWQVTGQKHFKRAAEDVLDYVLRELQHPQGGFYCGEDADSEGAEGTYYLWSLNELGSVLSAKEKNLFSTVYNITAEGNFEGRNILYRTRSLKQLAEQNRLSEDELSAQLNQIRTKLLNNRERRPHPHLDDKILSGWNGLMIASLARAGLLFERDDYLSAARAAVDFINNTLFTNGTLKRRYRDGETAVEGFHEDYAYFIRGLTELFLAEPDRRYLETALKLNKICDEKFRGNNGEYFDAERAFTPGMGRGRNRQDGAVPAAASVTAFNLLRLARLTGQKTLETQGNKLLELHLSQADSYPTAFAFLLQALDLSLSEQLTLVIVRNSKQLDAKWHSVVSQFRPQLLTLIVDETNEIGRLVPWCADKTCLNNRTTAWLCTAKSCLPATTSAEELERLLQRHAPLKTFSR